MLGAGVFSAFAPAAAAAGSGLLLGLLVAGAIAYCNAVASAQLAAVYPTSGGTYTYGRERLGEWWGFIAGWGFVVGKVASCAAMALTFASYAVPGPTWLQRLVGVAAVVLLTAANYRGISKTAVVTRTLVALTIIVLLGLVVAVLGTGSSDTGNLAGWWSADGHGVYGVLQAAGLLFFAFAGYARIATLGEEVREPERTIPRAIPIALGIVFVLSLAVGVTGLLAAGADRLAESTAPLATAVESVGLEGLAPIVRVGAALASLGTLIVLIAGVGRTTLAMARNADLPGWLAAVHPRFSVPHHAELAVAVVVCVLVLSTNLRGVIGFSSFGVLTYYAIANASAFTQPASDRRWPRTLNVLGVLGCAVLAFALPIGSVVAGLVVLTVGVLGRLMVRRRR